MLRSRPLSRSVRSVLQQQRLVGLPCLRLSRRKSQPAQSPVWRSTEKRGVISPHQNPRKDAPLIEQLFPEESRRYEEQQQVVPRISSKPARTSRNRERRMPGPYHQLNKMTKPNAQELLASVRANNPGTAVLVLRNASPNLTEEDFRRLIPRGKHIEGWTLTPSDIIKVIPGRDFETLAHLNLYYLLFSTGPGAFEYQGNATRIHHLAAAHTPSSISSPMSPPPGYNIKGFDVHASIESYTLAPPTGTLELRLLKPPHTPFVESIIRLQAHPVLVNRAKKMPYEVRLTMEGPQLDLSSLRRIMMDTARDRALTWSGGEHMSLAISKFEPRRGVSGQDRSAYAQRLMEGEPSEGAETESHTEPQTELPPDDGHARRKPSAVYIVGFHTESAAKSFVLHWHRRPLESPDDSNALWYSEGDLPPVANAELLW